MIDKAKNRENFLQLASTIKRDGMAELLQWLDTTDFFTSPASTKYHLSESGGLCQHSLNVAMCYPYDDKFLPLFHDLGKVGFYTTELRNAKNDKGEWVKVSYYTCDDKTLPLGHEMRTIYLLTRFVELTEEEICAIMYHHGGFGNAVKGGDFAIQNAWKKFQKALELHIADLKATYIFEK